MNALVCLVESLHLGYLGCFGNEWIGTPAIDRFAAESVTFDQCTARTPQSGEWLDRLLSTGTLRNLRGEQNLFVTGVSNVDWGCPTPDAFDEQWCSPEEPTDPQSAAKRLMIRWSRSVQESVPTLGILRLALLQEEGSIDQRGRIGANLANLVTSSGVEPIEPEPLQAIRDGYCDVVQQFDELFAMILERLEELQVLDETLVVLAADRGVPLGEHGMVGLLAPQLFDEVVHVPLIARLPRGRRGARSPALVQSLDLGPTLAEWFERPVPSGEGRSLVPLLRSHSARHRDYAISGLQDQVYALRTNSWKLLQPMALPSDEGPPQRSLFAKPEDQWDLNDIAVEQEAIADRLELQLRRHLDAIARGTPWLIEPLPRLPG